LKKEKRKGSLHPNNIHNKKYDLNRLVKVEPELKNYLIKNPVKETTLDFSEPSAVKILNRALLKTYYGISYWDIPEGFLCPPIPGRVDYIHYLSDLVKKDSKIKVLDIGTGANCIYPILGSKVYNWNFVGSDIDLISVENAKKIIGENSNLGNKIEIRQQENRNSFFKGIVKEGEKFNLTMCNPPFFSSLEEAIKSNRRKVKSLSKTNKKIKEGLNFGGQKAELWCKGGEKLFLKKMVKESKEFKDSIDTFTSLVSNIENISSTEKLIKKLGGKSKVIEMSHGNKKSRILIWWFK